jgi:Protein of unknown function (DUF2628)
LSETTATSESDDLWVAKIDAFVRRKADYYRPVWMSFATANSSKVRFNFAAAIFGVGWLLYRKLYLVFSIVIVTIIADSTISFYLEETGVVSRTVVTAWDRLGPLVYGGVVGTWANYWYFLKFRRLENLSKDHSPDPEAQKAFLNKRGGVSLIGPLAIVIVIAAVVFWAVQWPQPSVFS